MLTYTTNAFAEVACSSQEIHAEQVDINTIPAIQYSSTVDGHSGTTLLLAAAAPAQSALCHW